MIAALLHPNFLESFPRIQFPETRTLIGFFHSRKNSCKKCHYEVKCRKALWLQAREALCSNCKRAWRFFLCKKCELLLRLLRSNHICEPRNKELLAEWPSQLRSDISIDKPPLFLPGREGPGKSARLCPSSPRYHLQAWLTLLLASSREERLGGTVFTTWSSYVASSLRGALLCFAWPPPSLWSECPLVLSLCSGAFGARPAGALWDCLLSVPYPGLPSTPCWLGDCGCPGAIFCTWARPCSCPTLCTWLGELPGPPCLWFVTWPPSPCCWLAMVPPGPGRWLVMCPTGPWCWLIIGPPCDGCWLAICPPGPWCWLVIGPPCDGRWLAICPPGPWCWLVIGPPCDGCWLVMCPPGPWCWLVTRPPCGGCWLAICPPGPWCWLVVGPPCPSCWFPVPGPYRWIWPWPGGGPGWPATWGPGPSFAPRMGPCWFPWWPGTWPLGPNLWTWEDPGWFGAPILGPCGGPWGPPGNAWWGPIWPGLIWAPGPYPGLPPGPCCGGPWPGMPGGTPLPWPGGCWAACPPRPSPPLPLGICCWPGWIGRMPPGGFPLPCCGCCIGGVKPGRKFCWVPGAGCRWPGPWPMGANPGCSGRGPGACVPLPCGCPGPKPGLTIGPWCPGRTAGIWPGPCPGMLPAAPLPGPAPLLGLWTLPSCLINVTFFRDLPFMP